MRILIAEDDTALAGFVRKGLEAEHYAVDVSNDGEQARALATELDYDLLILDLNLPRLDGVNILRRVRAEKPNLPIVVLTARGRVDDRVMCLDAGADDYVMKPFSFSELSARIRALLRRSRLPSEAVLVLEDLKLDRVQRRVTRGTRTIELTSKEFALLEYLMRNAGRRVTRAMIIEHVWNLSFDSATNLVDVYVACGLRVPEVLSGPTRSRRTTFDGASFKKSLARKNPPPDLPAALFLAGMLCKRTHLAASTDESPGQPLGVFRGVPGGRGSRST